MNDKIRSAIKIGRPEREKDFQCDRSGKITNFLKCLSHCKLGVCQKFMDIEIERIKLGREEIEQETKADTSIS